MQREKKPKRKLIMKNKEQIRCHCGKLYLIKTRDGYEFKCSRCKRIHLLRYEQLIADYIAEEEANYIIGTI